MPHDLWTDIERWLQHPMAFGLVREGDEYSASLLDPDGRVIAAGFGKTPREAVEALRLVAPH